MAPVVVDRSLPLGWPGSRVVVAGTANHVPGSGLLDVPAVTDTVRDLGRVFVERCGLAPDRLAEVVDPTQRRLHEVLLDAAEHATEMLLFYYIGHGLVSPSNELYLATSDTDHVSRALASTALPYSAVRDALTECQARSIVVVLDCCFAGRARGSFGTPVADALDLATLGGTYLLAAASPEEQALAPEGAEHTTFSGELVRLLREGDPAAPSALTVEDAYRYLARVLPPRGAPAPHRQLSGRTDALVLAHNPAAPPVTAPLPTAPSTEDTVDASTQRPCPYRGLESFTVEDARYFFGRDELVAELSRRVARQYRDSGLVAVVGPSGSGKSSLLHAGLLTGVANGLVPVPGSHTWPHVAMTPGEHPLHTIASRLATPAGSTAETLRAELAADPASLAGIVRRVLLTRADGHVVRDGRLLLVVDQFEEVFTACEDEGERAAFVAALSAASTSGDEPAPAVVVLGVRADFYGNCLTYPELLPAVEDGQVLVTPMSRAQLREAIEKPAEAAGLRLEAGLADLMLQDLGSRPDTDGALPLLSFALLSTWQRRADHTLTMAGYRASGGIWDAVARRADQVFDALDPAARRAARAMLLRMVRIGDGTEEPRRVDRADLVPHHPAGEAALEAFVGARLVTVDQDGVRITHEALLRTWPRLRRWISEDRAGMVVHQQLTEAAESWRDLGRDRGGLYRGARLAAAQQWMSDKGDRAEIAGLEREFLDASTRAGRLRRWLAVGAVAVILVATGAGVFAVQQARIVAERDAVLASQQLAARAEVIRAGDPAAALRLSLAAYRLSPTPEARAALYTSDTTPYPTPLRGHEGEVRHVSYSPDGRVLASADDGDTIRLWDVSDPRRPAAKAVLRTPGDAAIAFSPTDDLLAAHTGRFLVLWDTTDLDRPQETVRVAADGAAANSLSFSGDGRTIAAGGERGMVQVWDVADPARPQARPAPPATAGAVRAVALRQDGNALATSSEDGTVRLLDLAGTRPVTAFTERISSPRGLAFSPDGSVLAVAGARGRLYLRVVTDLRRPGPTEPSLGLDLSYEFLPDDGDQWSVAFSEDGTRVAAAGQSGWVSRADVGDLHDTGDFSWRARPTFYGSEPINAVAYGPDNLTLATAGADGVVRVWATPGPRIIPHQLVTIGERSQANGTAFDTGGRLLVATDSEGGAQLWDTTDPRQPRMAGTLPVPWGGAMFLPDGRTLLAESNDFTTSSSLWNVEDPSRPVALTTFPTGRDVHVDLDGEIAMLLGEQPGTVDLWDISDPAHPRPAATVTSTTNTNLTGSGFVLFGLLNKGRLLGSLDDDFTPRVWDITDPYHPGEGVLLRNTRSFDPDRPRVAGGELGDYDDNHLMHVDFNRGVTIWDVTEPGRPVKEQEIPVPASDVELIHDGRLMVTWSGAEQTLAFWNTDDVRDPLTTLLADTILVRLYVSPNERVVAATLSGAPGGASSTGGDRIQFWDTPSATAVLERTDLPERAHELEFSPDNHTLAADVEDPYYGRGIRLWELDADRLRDYLCSTTGDPITEEEWARLVPSQPYRQQC